MLARFLTYASERLDSKAWRTPPDIFSSSSQSGSFTLAAVASASSLPSSPFASTGAGAVAAAGAGAVGAAPPAVAAASGSTIISMPGDHACDVEVTAV